MSAIIYVGQDMSGAVCPSEYVDEEIYARQGAEDGHHYFFYDGDLGWLDEFRTQARIALENFIDSHSKENRQSGPNAHTADLIIDEVETRAGQLRDNEGQITHYVIAAENWRRIRTSLRSMS